MGNDNSKSISKQKVATSFVWNILEKFFSQGLQFIVSIILARILIPSDYGIVALITVLIQVANVFVIDGFNTSLIQKKDSDELDFSSVFYFTCAVAIFLYICFYASAPLIAKFYDQPVLISLTRLLAISFFYTPLSSCQYAYIAKHMLFKVYLLRSIFCMVISGTISIILATKGAGVYALVIQSLTYGIINCTILWFSIDWRPKLLFSFERIKELLSFGWKFVGTGLLDAVFKNLYSLIIGKAYNTEQLGFYNRGQQFPGIIANNFSSTLRNITLPTFSAKNDDIHSVKNMVEKTVSVNAYIIFPLLMGLAVCAESVVRVVLTDKWLPCVHFLQISCVYFIFNTINDSNFTAINALGRSDVYLKYGIIKKIITVFVLIISIPFGVYAIALGQTFVSFISALLNCIPSKRILQYSYREQLKDILPSFLISVIMASIVYLCNFLPLLFFLKLILQILLGCIIYLFLSVFSKNENYYYLKQILKNRK